jgi:myo-inositol-1(or 4)-monophosphatase
MVGVARHSGKQIGQLFSEFDRVVDRESLITAYRKVEAVSAEGLREKLLALRPGSGWLEDDPEKHREVLAGSGEWWIVDGVEGAVNFIHGVPEFSVSITLIRDGAPVLAVVHQPIGDRTTSSGSGSPSSRRRPC